MKSAHLLSMAYMFSAMLEPNRLSNFKHENETHSSLSEDEKAAKKGMNKMFYKGEVIYYASKKSLKKKMIIIDKQTSR